MSDILVILNFIFSVENIKDFLGGFMMGCVFGGIFVKLFYKKPEYKIIEKHCRLSVMQSEDARKWIIIDEKLKNGNFHSLRCSHLVGKHCKKFNCPCVYKREFSTL